MGLAQLTSQERKILKGWRSLFWDFTKREWVSVFVCSALGIVAGGLARLILSDRSFQAFLSSRYTPTARLFDDPKLYLPYAASVAVAAFLAIAFRIPGFARRYARSWWHGVTSGLAPLSFIATLVAFALPARPVWFRLAVAVSTVAFFFVVGFALHVRARLLAGRTPVEDDLRVFPRTRPSTAPQWSESDDPIRTWEEDTIGREALVDSLSVKLMISKTPVLALFGELGSGKTSTLNLLHEHLDDKAIVVFFSTWLPGSQETFTTYLLSDIANECQKQYSVPGLRKGVGRLARALGQNVPLVRSYLELLPNATQRDDIESVHQALARLPKRVIVLLDELDRMEKDELIALLKVIRGVSHLPNLSFVCAGDFKTIVKTVKNDFSEENAAYFEKFFFDVIDIPHLDPAALKRAGTQRLAATLRRRNWFEMPDEEDKFRKQLEAAWEAGVAPFCRTLRAVGLLANAVGAAAAPLVREVHPVDLTLLEVLRRFRPQIYNIVARNSVALTGGAGMLRGGAYHSEKEKEGLEKKLLSDLQEATAGSEETAVKEILSKLFPRFRKIGGSSRSSVRLSGDDKSEVEDLKRISQPEMFPAYFRYELPEAIFPSVEMDRLLQEMAEASKAGSSDWTFQQLLDSMEKGSLKRDDCLRKLAEAASKSVPVPLAKALAYAAIKAANKYTYDMLAAFGEAGHVLRLVLRVAQRLPASERDALLQQCILDTTDDTMALNILTRLTGAHDDFNLEVSEAQLRPAFIKRMRQRYGREVDAAGTDLSTADPWAFNYWGHIPRKSDVPIDPEDRAIQRDFWLGYIGNSRARLAQAFRGFFMPSNVSYSEDPAPFVENKIPLSDLKRLYEDLPDDDTLNDSDRLALRVLKKLLDGEFKNGAGFSPYSDEQAAPA